MEVQELEVRWGPWPWLLFKHGADSRIMSVFSTSHENEPRVNSVLELENKMVYNCSHGWLILSTRDDSYTKFSLWNPVSLQSISLPRLESSVGIINACILSSDPNNVESMVFLFDRDTKSIYFCRIHGDDKRWIEQSYEKEMFRMKTDKFKDYFHTPIICEGKLYCLTFCKLMLVRIEILEKGNKIVLRIKPSIRLPFRLNQSGAQKITRQLIESCGDIFTICVSFENRDTMGRFGNEIISVEVHKLNLIAKAWEKTTSVGDPVFFSCDDGTAILCSAIFSGIKRNHIYFIRLKDLHLYSYDIEAGLLSIRLPFPNSQTPQESPMWIIPHIRSTNSFRQALTINGKGVQSQDEETMEAEDNEENISNRRTCHELPLDDLMKYISYKLNFFSYKNFRAVSSNLRKLTSPSSEVNFKSPWLLYFQKSKGVFNIFGPERGDRYIVQVPESLQDATICYCKDGWLLMCKYKQAQDHRLGINFVNPFDKKVIQYPDIFLEFFSSSRFSFSCSPTSSSCVVVILTYSGSGWLNVCSSREEGWKRFELMANLGHSISFGNNQIFVNGAFYFMSQYRELGVLRLEGDWWQFDFRTGSGRNYLSHHQGFLAECNGEIISVFINDTGKWIGFKLNSSTSLWEKLTSLGKYTMYASRMSSFIIKAETPEMEDKIYLPKFHEAGKMVALCLKTGKYFSASGDGSSKDWYGAKEQLGACWIRPN